MPPRLFALALPGPVTVYGLPADLEDRWASPVDDQGRPAVLTRTGHRKPATVTVEGTAAAVTFTRPALGPVLDYRLADPSEASPRWPLAYSTDEWANLSDDDQDHYRARRADVPPETLTVDLTAHVPWPLTPDDAEATPPTLPEGARWQPATAWADLFGMPSHDHLVPGYLSGFHKAAELAIAEHPNHLPDRWPSSFRVERGVAKRVAFTFTHEDNLPAESKPRRRRLGATPLLRQTVHVDLQIGDDHVAGTSLADALAKWHRRLADVYRQTPDAGHVCARCRGVGFVTASRWETDTHPRVKIDGRILARVVLHDLGSRLVVVEPHEVDEPSRWELIAPEHVTPWTEEV